MVVRFRRSGPSREVAGFLAPSALAEPQLQLLTETGQSLQIAQDEVLAVFFVSAFAAVRALTASWTGARSGARLPGLWVRVRSREHTRWDGILASDLLDVSAGIWLTPLHAAANVQRVFIPRGAVEKIEPIEVVRPGRRRRVTPAQFQLFGEVTQERSKETG